MTNKFLVVSQTQSFPAQTPRALAELTIDGDILLTHLLDDQLSATLYLSCLNLTTLSIVSMVECASRLTEHILGKLFEFIESLTKLARLSIHNFTLGAAAPADIWHSPVSVAEVTITQTHGASLSYLLKCIQPRNLRLDCCWFIRDLPSCERLVLQRIQRFDGFAEVLSTWDGGHLDIRQSAFLDESFILDLRSRMEESKQPIWQHASVSCGDCSVPVRIEMVELLNIRSHLM